MFTHVATDEFQKGNTEQKKRRPWEEKDLCYDVIYIKV